MEEVQKDACHARALVNLNILFLVGQDVLRLPWTSGKIKDVKWHIDIIRQFLRGGLQQGQVKRNKIPRSFAMTMSDVSYCSLGHRTGPRWQTYGGAEAVSCLAHLCARFTRWNCGHVTFVSVWQCLTLKRASFSMVRRCPHKLWPKQQGQWQRLLVVVVWCALLMFYRTSCPIMPYRQEKLFCCLVWLRSRFPISTITFLRILFHWQAEPCHESAPLANLEQAGQLKDMLWSASFVKKIEREAEDMPAN